MKKSCHVFGLLVLTVASLFHSHISYSRRAAAARMLLEGCAERPGRIYFVSFPENCLAVSILGWHPADDRDRGSMAWRCWQIGGYRCGNIARQAFDAARGEGHLLDLLWGGFPGADAPSVGTEKTVYLKER